MIPKAAVAILALFCQLTAGLWPAMPLPSALPAQVEQETCITLTSKECFSPHAELKTSREYGFGLGQLTVTSEFNAWQEVKRQAPALLGNWAWSDRYDATKQVQALLVMDHGNYVACMPLMHDGFNALACALSAYNGGMGGFQADRRLCGNTKGCDPHLWFGNIELVSTKAKKPVSGYDQSFYDINRSYVKNILFVRSAKYRSTMQCLSQSPTKSLSPSKG
jgi:hypothetical protein